MYVKNIKNLQFDDWIFKICSYVNYFNASFSQQAQLSLQLNFVLKNTVAWIFKEIVLGSKDLGLMYLEF